MWTQLKNCRVGDKIKAVFLNNLDPADPRDTDWHTIYELNAQGGQYYVAVERWGGRLMRGDTEVFKK